MPQLSIYIRASWDDEANVWVARTSDVDGLAAEAPTFDELRTKVFAMLDDLLELNGYNGDNTPDIPVHIIAEQSTRIANPSYE